MLYSRLKLPKVHKSWRKNHYWSHYFSLSIILSTKSNYASETKFLQLCLFLTMGFFHATMFFGFFSLCFRFLSFWATRFNLVAKNVKILPFFFSYSVIGQFLPSIRVVLVCSLVAVHYSTQFNNILTSLSKTRAALVAL